MSSNLRHTMFNNNGFVSQSSKDTPNNPDRSPFGASKTVVESITRKLIPEYNTTSNSVNALNQDEQTGPLPTSQYIQETAQETAASISDSENMLNVLPDLNLGMQIVIANILSPNDMMSTELTYDYDSNTVGDIGSSLINVIRDHFEDIYKIKPQLNKILEDILFKTGSYPLAIIPENSLDHAINSRTRVSMESLSEDFVNGKVRNLGVLGNSNTLGNSVSNKPKSFYESITTNTSFETDITRLGLGYQPDVPDFYLSIHDNPNVLKHPILHDKVSQDRLADIYGSFGLGMESDRNNMWDDVDDKGQNVSSLYKPRNFQHTPTLMLRPRTTLEKETVGHPLVLHVPSEAVIPVHVPSNPEQHIGYFIVMDQTGNPIKANTDSDYYRQLMASNGNSLGAEFDSFMMDKVNSYMNGDPQQNRQMTYEDRVNIYMDLVKRDLNERLSNGVYSGSAVVSSWSEVYRIMFARLCQHQYTQLVFCPVSMFTYMAFNYKNNGVGESLLDATKILGNLRMVNLFANSRASIKNSINRELVNVTLSPKDKDPIKTMSLIKHLHAEAGYSEFPFRARPQDITRFIARAGTQYSFTGNPRLPETRVDVQQMQNNHIKVDTEFDELLKKWQLMGIGVAPEAVDMSMSPDFATSVISSNILQAKRALNQQEQFTFHLADFMRKYTYASSILMNELRGIVKENRNVDPVLKALPKQMKEDAIINRFLQTFTVSLPSPKGSQLKMQLENYEEYERALDSMLKNFMSEELLNGTELGKLKDYLPVAISAYKGIKLREYMRVNNILPELFDLLSKDDKGKTMVDLLEDHSAYVEQLTPSIVEFMKRAAKNGARIDKDLKGVKLGDADGDFGGGGGGWGDDNSGGGGDGFDGDGDMGGMDDSMGDENMESMEEPIEEEPEEGSGDMDA